MSIVEKIRKEASERGGTVVLPEGMDKRMQKAASVIVSEGIGKAVLLGNPDDIRESAANEGVTLDGVEIIDHKSSGKADDYAEILLKRREKKGMTKDKALEAMKNELYFGAAMVAAGDASGCVAGANNTTGDVIRSALHVIGLKEGISVISGAFLMVVPDYPEKGSDKTFIYADCGVCPDPSSAQLASIAAASSATCKMLTGEDPVVAMLSFSTKGSADHPHVTKVQDALKIASEKFPELNIDGELQFDAAVIPAIGKKKAPDSKVAGNANVLVFPDLNSGNIGYKITERLAGAFAVGPLLQGLAKPVNDLSRGCSVDDIVSVSAITLLQS
ncbi:MAG: phosphate acetyltransferase [Fibrobacterota bacterium]